MNRYIALFESADQNDLNAVMDDPERFIKQAWAKAFPDIFGDEDETPAH